jgi:tetratricopeptide (TPR) repeat protein
MASARQDEVAVALRQGIGLFQQGRADEAEALIGDLRRRHPENFDVLHILGIMLVQGRDPEQGIALIRRALEMRDFAPAWNNLGNGYRRLQCHGESVMAYERAIALQPGFVEAHNNRGNALVALDRPAEALADFDEAVRLGPDFAEAHSNRGAALLKLGRAGEALAAASKALTLAPNLAEACVVCAEAQLAQGDADAAMIDAEKALRLKPGLADAHVCRGDVLMASDQPDGALAAYGQAIRLNPRLPPAHNNRGNALRALGRNREALESYDTAIALKPDYAEAFNNRGRVLKGLQGPEAALASYDQAIALVPNYAGAHSNRGNMLLMLGRPEAALADHDAAIALQPDNFRAHNNRGNALLDLKQLDGALQSYERAIALRPGYAEAHWNRGIALLLQGRWEEGWPEYAHRHRAGFAAPQDIYPADRLWTGEQDLAGKNLLIHCEQGLGDAIQFCRYALIARDKGARVSLLPHKGLAGLLRGLGPDFAIVDSPAAGFDYHVPLLDMPQACGTTPDTVPWPGPYLHAEPERMAHWRTHIGPHGLKIGIGWQGNPDSPSDIGRSFPVRLFETVSRRDGVRLIALQKGAGLEQLDHLPAGMAIERLPSFDEGSDAFLDTAAVMANLDLIITSDTAIAHLAGALGRPVLVALKYVPDWRWLLERDDSPWYPNMQLIRQPRPGDWQGAFAQIEARVSEILRRR